MDDGQPWLVSSYLTKDIIQLFTGRVGYGASLEGTVGPFSHSRSSITYQHISGPTLTIPVTSARCPTRHSTVVHRQLLPTVTRITAMCFLISLVSVCRGALAKENPIRVLCTQTGRTLAALHPKLISSSHRCC